ncbi:hypothetical protein M430DRAFT_50364 [Amorphotheca resinae ATCC 22711]|uniref:ABC transporter domain-containing protein n=1 Tax=Amorphotheca resinae ATCC 22711 TaxID=857342 RepID=A0A2T3B137_AMORE|nr:hypothetical protein M430DRAFT_50364 [Amorphotheca resinae ATCC 22711]PSS18276.1 hypothetical protein M430DRAFT_50364 [Amorphotheca resinae ATCC 22711]
MAAPNNTLVKNFGWQDITVTVKDHKTKQPKALLYSVSRIVKASELCALIGPLGYGKTTLLNVLAYRDATAGAKVAGVALVNSISRSREAFCQISSYVEQEDALIGSLTVQETLSFAARLSNASSLSKLERMNLITGLLDSTPIRKGISRGQKRRVSVASQLITGPKLLFLDEPISGLDSTASLEMFDKVLLLSVGKPYYFGSVPKIAPFFKGIGHLIPPYTNLAEFVLKLMNVDFSQDQEAAIKQLGSIQESWATSAIAESITTEIKNTNQRSSSDKVPKSKAAGAGVFLLIIALIHRAFIKSYRDVVAYAIRVIMYLGLAIMIGTVWLRLGSIVAYVPAFLEDRAAFAKERANGLYGAAPFVLSNFIIGLPYLFIIAVLFSVIMWLFLDLVAAESLVVLISSLFPNFVVTLISVGGFLVPPNILNVFWYYVFSYIDYQVGLKGTWVGILIGIIAGYRLLGWAVLVVRK